MCGIVGLAGTGFDVDRARDVVMRMASRIEHRGPDGGGVSAHGDVALGMKRLAIVDLANGEQPMLSDDGRITLVYNGEIYNAPALRSEIHQRIVFADSVAAGRLARETAPDSAAAREIAALTDELLRWPT